MNFRFITASETPAEKRNEVVLFNAMISLLEVLEFNEIDESSLGKLLQKEMVKTWNKIFIKKVISELQATLEGVTIVLSEGDDFVENLFIRKGNIKEYNGRPCVFIDLIDVYNKETGENDESFK